MINPFDETARVILLGMAIVLLHIFAEIYVATIYNNF